MTDVTDANPPQKTIWSGYQSSLIIVTGVILVAIVALLLKDIYKPDGTEQNVRFARSQLATMAEIRNFPVWESVQDGAQPTGSDGHHFWDRSHSVVALRSNYPFPQSKNRPLDDFDARALESLTNTGASEFSEVAAGSSGKTFRYAGRVLMDAGCVRYHNARPDSPKTDWKVGDVSGVEVVEFPVNSGEGLKIHDLGLLLLISLSGLATIITLLVQSNRAKRASAVLYEKNLELEAEKLRADEASKSKTQFLSNMSHEIRTPLNGIIGTLQIIDPATLSRENEDYFGIIRRSSLTLLDIVNSILDLSKIEADEATLSMRSFNLRSLVSDILTHHSVLAGEKDIDLLIHFDSTIPENVFSDPAKVEQILNNLLSNALKLSSPKAARLSLR